MRMIKLLPLMLAAFAAVSLSSCDKIVEKLAIDIDYGTSDMVISIPEIEEYGTYNFGEAEVFVNLDSLIKTYDESLGIKNIKSAKIESCRLELIGGDAANNFSVIESAGVHFRTNDKPEVTIASVKDNPDQEAYELDLPVEKDLELRDYFEAESYSYRVEATTRKPVTSPLEARIHIKFKLRVGL